MRLMILLDIPRDHPMAHETPRSLTVLYGDGWEVEAQLRVNVGPHDALPAPEQSGGTYYGKVSHKGATHDIGQGQGPIEDTHRHGAMCYFPSMEVVDGEREWILTCIEGVEEPQADPLAPLPAPEGLHGTAGHRHSTECYIWDSIQDRRLTCPL